MAPGMRKVIGATITCKAPECIRGYGTYAKTKVLDGVIVNIIQDCSNPMSGVQHI
jgi:hypothetical protein